MKSTQVTFEGLLSRVRTQMPFQGATLSKRQHTHITIEGFLSSVRTQMPFQVAMLSKAQFKHIVKSKPLRVKQLSHDFILFSLFSLADGSNVESVFT